MSTSSQQDSRPVLKRPRPVLSCLECRRKKLKCDRLLPCQQCLKLGKPSGCAYAPGQEPEPRGDRPTSEPAAKQARYDISETNGVAASSNQIGDLHDRVQKLEEALRLQQSACSSPCQTSGGENVSSSVGYSTPGISIVEESSRRHPAVATAEDNFSVFKQFEEAAYFIRSLQDRLHEPDVDTLSSQLFAIQRAITKPATARPTSVAIYPDIPTLVYRMIQLLPPPHVRGRLIDLYFENFEHCTRIIHKTDFISRNQQYEQGQLGPNQVEYFVPALVGILTIASVLNTYPECDLPNLYGREDGIESYQLINNWYDLVVRRDGPTMTAIQIRLLATQIQRYRDPDTINLWFASGQLVRQAMSQDFHKEGLPHMSNREAEVRRCLWLAILEQDLILAITREMPPLCPYYDLRAPANCDDDELSETSAEDPPNHPTSKWTDGLCQHILGTTFNQRLEAYKHRFAVKTPSHYASTMEWVRSLERILRDQPPLFRLDYTADSAANTPGRLMAQMDLDIALRRPLIAACAPYARILTTTSGTGTRELRPARVSWVQSHLVVMCFQDLFDPQFDVLDVPNPTGYWDFFYTAYRYDVVQSLEAMLIEAKHLKRVESGDPAARDVGSGTGPGPGPSKLMRWNFSAMMKSIEDTLDPMERRIGSRGADLKQFVGYALLYYCLRSSGQEDLNEHVFEGLKGCVHDVRKRLERNGYAIDSRYTPERREGWLVEFLRPESVGAIGGGGGGGKAPISF